MNQKISRSLAAQITADIELAVQSVLAAHGLQQEKVNTKYGDVYEFRITANIPTLNEQGVNVASESAQAWVLEARYNPLCADIDDPAAVLGTRFSSGGHEWVFDGWNSRARRFPIVATRVADGKKYKIGEGVLSTILTAYRAAVSK
jgi:hypothetical protein